MIAQVTEYSCPTTVPANAIEETFFIAGELAYVVGYRVFKTVFTDPMI